MTVPKPHKVYETLLRRFGPQRWWPVTLGGGPFEVCAGAILTQNTAWTNVEKALRNLDGLLTARKVASSGAARLARLVRPSGYYNQKAARLGGFAKYVCRKYGGDVSKLLAKPLGEAREELLSLKGIGPETADSMLLYGGGRRTFVVDAYTLRLASRMGWKRAADYTSAKEFFESTLPRSAKLYNEFHALIVALCKYHCRKRPLCGQCPLERTCRKSKS